MLPDARVEAARHYALPAGPEKTESEDWIRDDAFLYLEPLADAILSSGVATAGSAHKIPTLHPEHSPSTSNKTTPPNA